MVFGFISGNVSGNGNGRTDINKCCVVKYINDARKREGGALVIVNLKNCSALTSVTPERAKNSPLVGNDIHPSARYSRIFVV